MYINFYFEIINLKFYMVLIRNLYRFVDVDVDFILSRYHPIDELNRIDQNGNNYYSVIFLTCSC